MSARATLLAAADLLERPGAWTQNVFARNSGGENVGVRHDSAACWCAMGAIRRIGGGAQTPATRDAVSALETMLSDGARNVSSDDDVWIPKWNDAEGRTQAEVVAMFRRCAEAQS